MGLGILSRLAADAATITRQRINTIYDALFGHFVPRNQQGAPQAGAGSLGQPTLPWDNIYYAGDLVRVGGGESGVAISGGIRGNNSLFSARMISNGNDGETRDLSSFLVPNGAAGVRIFASPSENEELVLRFGSETVTITSPINVGLQAGGSSDVYQFPARGSTTSGDSRAYNGISTPIIASANLRLNGSDFDTDEHSPELFWRCGATGCILVGVADYRTRSASRQVTETFRPGGDGGNEPQTRIVTVTGTRSYWTFASQSEIRFGTSGGNSDIVNYNAVAIVQPDDYPITSAAGMNWIYIRRDGTAFARADFPANVPNPLAFPQSPDNGQQVYASFDGNWYAYNAQEDRWIIQEIVFLGWALRESNGSCLFARGVIPIERQELIEQIAFGNFRSQTINGFLTQSAPFDS